MAKPIIRCSLTADGHIEATCNAETFSAIARVVVERRTGDFVECQNAGIGTDLFRWLINAAREQVALERRDHRDAK